MANDLFAIAQPGALVAWIDARTDAVKRGRVAIKNNRDRILVVNVGGRYGTPFCLPADRILSVSGGRYDRRLIVD
jgi:uncharacterized protein (DUF1786 family)